MNGWQKPSKDMIKGWALNKKLVVVVLELLKALLRAFMLRRLLHNNLTTLKPSIVCQNALTPSSLTSSIYMTPSLSTSRFYQLMSTQSDNIKNDSFRLFKISRMK
ncbi:hypothetical protein TorRG33x02_004310 [Trema orientale]|uniref:Uncharacterized protein n=1 Tax=Trema orientale TaxID=63057 RepID=A0A2P5G290_TREOI|nr:hypothetical protein TorRG33x02_004310 [Trema orientale]